MPEDNTFTTTNQTYEEATALASISKTADPIHYNPNYSYRNSPYRHLHHQNGTIGKFHVRLLEAKNLKRNSWNLLGLGPVKHLGLSRAHGEVTSYAVLRLGFRSRCTYSYGENDDLQAAAAAGGMASTMNMNMIGGGGGGAVKPPAAAAGSSSHYSMDSSHSKHSSSLWGNESIASAVATTAAAAAGGPMSAPLPASTSASTSTHSFDPMKHSTSQKMPSIPPTSPGITNSNTNPGTGNTYYSKTYQSTIIPFNSNPKWPTVQTDSNRSKFDMDLYKNMPYDGMEISLQIQMREEKTAADNAMNIMPVQGIIQGGDDLIGEAELNLTELVLRGFSLGGGDGDRPRMNGRNGGSTEGRREEKEEEVVDVWDRWIHLDTATATGSGSAAGGNSNGSAKVAATSNNDDERDNEHNSNNNERRPQIRILVSYEPNGFHPRRGDVVALESFARRPISACKSRPIISPLHPLRVKDIRGEYLLCTFDMNMHPQNYNDMTTNVNGGGLLSSSGSTPSSSSSSFRNRKKHRTGTVRLHRNTIFVIERTNLVDSAMNAALKPADVVLSTPMGKEVSDVVQPYVESAGDLLMPAVLSAKLMLEAAKVGGGAFVVGLKSAAVAVAESQDPEKKRRARRRRTFSD